MKLNPAVSALAAIFVTAPWAMAGTGILANSNAFKPQITLGETLTEKLVRYFTLEPDPANPGDEFDDANGNNRWDAGEELITDHDGDNRYDAPKFIKVYGYGKMPSQKVNARIVANLKGVGTNPEDPESGPVDFDFDSINEETPVSITVGDYSFSSTLGAEEGRGVFTRETTINGVLYEAGQPKPLGSSALYKLGYSYPKLDSSGNEVTDEEGNPVTLFKQTGSIKVEWSRQSKTVTFTLEERTQAPDITPQDPTQTGATSIAADRLAVLSTRASRNFANQPIPVSVTFGSASGARVAYGRGVIKSRFHRVLSEENPYVRSVSLTAAADTEGPKLRLVVPAAADPELFGVDFLGGVTDRPSPTFPGVFPLPEELADASDAPELGLLINGQGQPSGDPADETTNTPFSIDFTDALGNPLPVDDDGNPTVPGYVNGNGFFGGFCELYEATNNLTFIATDADGNVTTLTRKVTAKPLEEFQNTNPAP
jgi:hypothetical protein